MKPEVNDMASLDQLKTLLLGEEKQQLEELNERIADPALRSSDIADILPDAIRHSGAQNTQLAKALEPTVTECLHTAIARDPDPLADALYPVMGPAIRMSISNTLRDLVSNINRTLEHSFSVKGLKWRLEAARTGIPFAEVVLRNTLAYRVEQVLLIQPQSGLLMQQAKDEGAAAEDADSVSGMLTAISQFVRDAFHADDNADLETVEMGDHTVMLLHGPYAYMACIIRGIPPIDQLREQFDTTLEQIHRLAAKQLQGFEGDSSTLENTRPLLDSCLISAEKTPTTGRKRLSGAFILLMAAILGLTGWGAYQWWLDSQQAKALAEQQDTLIRALQNEPGIALGPIERGEQGGLHLQGLRDPLAKPITQLVEQAGLQAQQVHWTFKPYFDLNPVFAQQRAKQRLSPPESVKLKVDAQGQLIVSGWAEQKWLQRSELLALTIPGVNSYDSSTLISADQHLQQQLNTRYQLPKGVTLNVAQGSVTVSGFAPAAWKRGFAAQMQQNGIENYDDSRLMADEQLVLEQLIEQLNVTHFRFESGATLGNQADAAHEVSILLRQANQLANELTHKLRVVLIGRTDGIGSQLLNQQLASARAFFAKDYFISQGLPASIFQLRAAPSSGISAVKDPSMRRVDIHVATEVTAGQESQ